MSLKELLSALGPLGVASTGVGVGVGVGVSGVGVEMAVAVGAGEVWDVLPEDAHPVKTTTATIAASLRISPEV